MSPADSPKSGIVSFFCGCISGHLPEVTSLQSNDIKYYTLRYLVTPLDTPKHRRRTFQPTVIESNSVSCETVFHTMQHRGFAAIYDCYLTFMTFGFPALDVRANQRHRENSHGEASFSSPSAFTTLSGFIIDEPPSVSSLWAPALASSGWSRECSGIGSKHFLERYRNVSYIMGLVKASSFSFMT